VSFIETALHWLRACVSPRLWAALALSIAACAVRAQVVAGLPDAPSSLIAAAQKQADESLPGTISGMVTDIDHAVVSGAQVTLTTRGGRDTLTAVSASDGSFRFANVAPGKFSITAQAEGMATGTESGTLQPGQQFELQELELTVASVASEVEAMSLHDQAEVELKLEEHQRLGGIVPNFYVVYNWDAAPLSSKQKFKLAFLNSIDPVNTGISAAVAGYEYWQNDLIGYGRGWQGYGKRFGASEADLGIGTFVGGAILPSILHQDPRYFYMGKGTITHRFLYAVASAVICKGDNGKWQPNYSSIGGDVATGGLANLYYPKSDRNGASLVIEQGLIGAAADGLGNVIQEFFFKKLTPHSPKYSSTTPQP
jgi:hypothetical protein